MENALSFPWRKYLLNPKLRVIALMRLKIAMVACCIILDPQWSQKGNFPKEDEKLCDLEAFRAASWRLFGIDEVNLSQLGLLVLSLWATSLRWGPTPIFGEILTPFPSLYIHPFPFPNGWSMSICTLMLRLHLYATHLAWRMSAWRD